MSNHVYIAASLDGYIATPDGGVEWLNAIPNPDGSDYGFAEFMSRIDAVVMGRKTFDVVLSFGQWPYDKPVIVLSNSLKSVPEELAGKAEIEKGAPAAIVERLAARGLRNLYVDGGMTIHEFLNADLIDEMTITTVAVLLGDGIPLFGKREHGLRFRHTKTEVLGESLVQNCYARVRE